MGSMRQLVMPKLGLTMTEGMVADWPIAEGTRFARGDIWLVVETEKVTNEVEAPAGGRLAKILVPRGETVPVGTVLAEWETDPGAALPDVSAAVAPAAPERRWRKASSVELAAARKLVESKQSIPHFYLATKIEVSRLQAMRTQHNAQSGRTKITLTHLIVAAVAAAVVRHPAVNRIWQEDGFVELEAVDVGVAVNTEQGLLVPMLREVDVRSLDALAAEMGNLVTRARAMALLPDDVGGGAITVSNAGMHDVTWMTSIINLGQSAILGVGTERRLFRPGPDGAPKLVREVGVVLSCDHRVIDGVRGLAFLNDVRAVLEAPEALFAR